MSQFKRSEMLMKKSLENFDKGIKNAIMFNKFLKVNSKITKLIIIQIQINIKEAIILSQQEMIKNLFN